MTVNWPQQSHMALQTHVTMGRGTYEESTGHFHATKYSEVICRWLCSHFMLKKIGKVRIPVVWYTCMSESCYSSHFCEHGTKVWPQSWQRHTKYGNWAKCEWNLWQFAVGVDNAWNYPQKYAVTSHTTFPELPFTQFPNDPYRRVEATMKISATMVVH